MRTPGRQLAYQIPGDGRRKTLLRIPESHTLYLCPNACGRRQGIRALRNGEADHVSFLSFAQTDVALGDYVGMVGAAVDEVLAFVEPRPRVLTLAVNCIDDFLGTDGDALLTELSARHPDVRFMLSHLNPIAGDVAGTAAVGVHATLYAPLDPVPEGERDRGVNAVGCFVPIPAASEFHEVLRALGAGPVRDLPSCATYADYAAMARSRLNLSLSLLGDAPCRDMEARLGIPCLAWPACYDLDEIARRYGELARMLGGELPDLAAWRAAAERAVSEARAALAELPLVVDTAASLMPFSLARALAGYGFTVAAVFALHSKGNDAGEAAFLREHPEVPVVRTQGLEAVAGLGIPRECLAVGRDAGFLLRARHLAPVYHDEGYFGFQGVARLMGDLAAAAAAVKEWDA